MSVNPHDIPDMQHALAALIQTPRPLEYLRLTGRSKPERSFSLSARNCSLRCRRGLRQRPVSASWFPCSFPEFPCSCASVGPR